MGTPPAKPTPLRNSYWVLPGKVLAGEHPGGTNREATRERLQRLIDAGVDCFIDLTEPGELRPYDPELPVSAEYLRKPIKDHGTPGQRQHMAEILDCMHDALQSGRCVYVHCRAGIGRTGTVIGCFLVERGLPGEAALDELNRLWQHCERSHSWASVPETTDQTEYVSRWKRRGIFDDKGALKTSELHPDPDDEPANGGDRPWAHLLGDGPQPGAGARGRGGASPPHSADPSGRRPSKASRTSSDARGAVPGAGIPPVANSPTGGPGASPPLGSGAPRAAIANAARAAANQSGADELLTDPTSVANLPQPNSAPIPSWIGAKPAAAGSATPVGRPNKGQPAGRASGVVPGGSRPGASGEVPEGDRSGGRASGAMPENGRPGVGASGAVPERGRSGVGASGVLPEGGRSGAGAWNEIPGGGRSGGRASGAVPVGGGRSSSAGLSGGAPTGHQSAAAHASSGARAGGINPRGGAAGASGSGADPASGPSGTPRAGAAGAAPGAGNPNPHAADSGTFRAAAGFDDADPLLDPEALAAASNLRSRFLGALIGLAVGDAVAATTQYRRPGSFTPIGDMLGGGPFDLPRGGWSDDTAMALCLADSLLERNGFDARDQVERYRRWQQEGYLSATGQCVGITASSARAIAMAQWRRQAFFGSHDPSQQDPEPLSRVAPAVLFYFATSGEAINQSTEAARTTCQAPAVLDSCRALAQAMYAALTGEPKAVVLGKAALTVAANTGGATTGASTDVGGPDAALAARAGSSAPAVLTAAIAAFGATDNFRDAVLYAANLGGDSDVVAAVAGQLAGAYYGVKAIPTSWYNGLMQKEMIVSYADRLLAHAMVGLGG